MDTLTLLQSLEEVPKLPSLIHLSIALSGFREPELSTAFSTTLPTPSRLWSSKAPGIATIAGGHSPRSPPFRVSRPFESFLTKRRRSLDASHTHLPGSLSA